MYIRFLLLGSYCHQRVQVLVYWYHPTEKQLSTIIENVHFDHFIENSIFVNRNYDIIKQGGLRARQINEEMRAREPCLSRGQTADTPASDRLRTLITIFTIHNESQSEKIREMNDIGSRYMSGNLHMDLDTPKCCHHFRWRRERIWMKTSGLLSPHWKTCAEFCVVFDFTRIFGILICQQLLITGLRGKRNKICLK